MNNGVMLQLMQGWSGFYELEGGASATLMGLLFVAISLNADLILAGDLPLTKRLAEQAFQNLTSVFVLSLWFLLPNQSPITLTTGLMTVSAIMMWWIGIRLFATHKTNDSSISQAKVVERLVPSLLAYLFIFLVSGAFYKTTGQEEVRGIAVATIILLMSALRTSWDLLVRVAEIRHLTKKE
jgi:hypothetical protein